MRAREGGGSLNKVALAHFDPFDLLKLNYSDPRTLEHEAAKAAVYSGGERKNRQETEFNNNNNKNNIIYNITIFVTSFLTETDEKDNLPTPRTRCC